MGATAPRMATTAPAPRLRLHWHHERENRHSEQGNQSVHFFPPSIPLCAGCLSSYTTSRKEGRNKSCKCRRSPAISPIRSPREGQTLSRRERMGGQSSG